MNANQRIKKAMKDNERLVLRHIRKAQGGAWAQDWTSTPLHNAVRRLEAAGIIKWHPVKAGYVASKQRATRSAKLNEEWVLRAIRTAENGVWAGAWLSTPLHYAVRHLEANGKIKWHPARCGYVLNKKTLNKPAQIVSKSD